MNVDLDVTMNDILVERHCESLEYDLLERADRFQSPGKRKRKEDGEYLSFNSIHQYQSFLILLNHSSADGCKH